MIGGGGAAPRQSRLEVSCKPFICSSVTFFGIKKAIAAAIVLLAVSLLLSGCNEETDNAVTVTHPKATMTGGGDLIEEDYGDEEDEENSSDGDVSESVSQEADKNGET